MTLKYIMRPIYLGTVLRKLLIHWPISILTSKPTNQMSDIKIVSRYALKSAQIRKEWLYTVETAKQTSWKG
jgi:hypothetical protein